jgi:hypothetical protein
MCIPHCHLNCLVPHQFRYRAEIHTVHHQATGKCVPQAVPGEVAEPGLRYGWTRSSIWRRALGLHTCQRNRATRSLT